MLVIIAKTGATDKCINKTHYIPTMEYYLPYKGIKYAPSRKKMYTGTFQKCLNNIIKKHTGTRTSLVVQWLRLCTPNAGAQVRPLLREPDPTCHTVARKK